MSALPNLTALPADAVPPTWTSEDIAALAYRCHAAGVTEAGALALMHALLAQGVRNPRRFTEAWTYADLEQKAALAEVVAGQVSSRRGDLIFVRSARRWPWRTSTSQPLPGVVA